MNINAPLNGGGFALPFTKAANYSRREEYDRAHQRKPVSHKMPNRLRTELVAASGEFVGTVLFLFLAFGATQVANTIHAPSGKNEKQVGSNPVQLQYIALSFGFSLAVNAWVFFRISGGLFNPAVTVGMCMIGALTWGRGVLLFFTQILGGLVAAALVSCMFPGPLAAQTTLSGGTSIAQGLFIEMLLTAELVFTIFMLAAEKHRGTFLAPVGIGLSLFVAELVGVYFTGGSLNPARSFGPAVVDHNFPGYHWIYWLGPCLGALVAAGFYKFIKMLEYETANPDQDAAGPSAAEKQANAAHVSDESPGYDVAEEHVDTLDQPNRPRSDQHQHQHQHQHQPSRPRSDHMSHANRNSRDMPAKPFPAGSNVDRFARSPGRGASYLV